MFRYYSLVLLILFGSLNINLLSRDIEKKYLIDSLWIDNNVIRVKACEKFKSLYMKEDFFVEYDKEIHLKTLDETILSIPFVMSVISMVWESGEHYYIHKMDKDLYESLKIIKEVYKVFYPMIKWNGELIADELIENKGEIKDDSEVGLLFTGGVDSSFTSFSYREKKQLLITYLGTYEGEFNQKSWGVVKKQCIEFAEKYGNRRNTFVKSNFREAMNFSLLSKKYSQIDPWQHYCEEGIAFSGLAAPLLYYYKCSKLLISSSRDMSFLYPYGSHPFIDSNINFGSIGVVHHPFDLSRLEKIKCIIKLCNEKIIEKPLFRVCRSGKAFENCENCMKCFNTMASLLIENEEPQSFGFSSSIKDARNKVLRAVTKFRMRLSNFKRFQDLKKHTREILLKNNKYKVIDKEYYNFLENFEKITIKLRFKYYNKKFIPPKINFSNYMYFMDTANN